MKFSIRNPPLRVWCSAALAISLGLSACTSAKDGLDRADAGLALDLGGDKPSPDVGVDGGMTGEDGGAVLDGGSVPTAENMAQVTSGGGRASSDNHRVRVTVGAPSPVGRASSSEFGAVIGTGGRQGAN